MEYKKKKGQFLTIAIKKKNLISIIQSTASFSNPKIELEQYCIDAISAVDIVYFAGFEFFQSSYSDRYRFGLERNSDF